VANVDKTCFQRELGFLNRIRVRSMGSIAKSIHGEARHASRTVVPKLVWVIPTPILRGSGDANHLGRS